MKVDIERVALHEAGHAVAHHVLGIAFDVVTVVPSDDAGTLGHVTTNTGASNLIQLNYGSRNREIAALARDHIICTLAGMAAEDVLLGNIYEAGCRRDVEQAMIDSQYRSRVPHAYFGKRKTDARKLIRENTSAVRAVAAALLERQSLTWCEVEAVFRGDTLAI